ncbi:MAG: hypothetical protein CR993_05095 [Rhodobacterales bacterium]|nr:MAG: hypothetical protein CR993_05095 [Rhodobacterales bacterium]
MSIKRIVRALNEVDTEGMVDKEFQRKDRKELYETCLEHKLIERIDSAPTEGVFQITTRGVEVKMDFCLGDDENYKEFGKLVKTAEAPSMKALAEMFDGVESPPVYEEIFAEAKWKEK